MYQFEELIEIFTLFWYEETEKIMHGSTSVFIESCSLFHSGNLKRDGGLI